MTVLDLELITLPVTWAGSTATALVKVTRMFHLNVECLNSYAYITFALLQSVARMMFRKYESNDLSLSLSTQKGRLLPHSCWWVSFPNQPFACLSFIKGISAPTSSLPQPKALSPLSQTLVLLRSIIPRRVTMALLTGLPSFLIHSSNWDFSILLRSTIRQREYVLLCIQNSRCFSRNILRLPTAPWARTPRSLHSPYTSYRFSTVYFLMRVFSCCSFHPEVSLYANFQPQWKVSYIRDTLWFLDKVRLLP